MVTQHTVQMGSRNDSVLLSTPTNGTKTAVDVFEITQFVSYGTPGNFFQHEYRKQKHP